MKLKRIFTILNFYRTIFAVIWFHVSSNKKNIIEDMYAYDFYSKGINNLNNKLSYLLINSRTFRTIFIYRIKNIFIQQLFKILFPPMKDLEIGGSIEGGLCIYHGYATVIQPHKIGKNCSIWQNVTIGRRPREGRDIDSPTIGNNVNIYTGAIVIGGINIGNNVDIGAGSVVTKDIPDNCSVIGNPFRVIKKES
ncbi:serine acetyltransferase [Neobacillus sp. MER 74]|uniref:serine acetyltransferase n=1 Tax=Neobacillus sp. MER 74 TaxID=2939566 RepID=UPI00203B0190|nr:serine acetyltransferase [Neobacillus sp. MER 74]MCM3116042.1 serine acetyltransferase [Neobacillus sp. MER 74]